ncbi:MAG: hypothetical protein NT007_00460 [Candidatus Kapabacteria bacterium]|nr:hypothetical protein [Candidatus Kapabacteria bacterium]
MVDSTSNRYTLQKFSETFLGYGDKESAKIWFIGIEEGKEFQKLEDLKTEAENFQISKEGESYHSPIYDVMTKIWEGLKCDDKQVSKAELFKKGNPVIQSNIYPLGKHSIYSWEKNYSEWFGFENEKEYYDWIESEVINKRFEIINNFKKENDNLLIICFGKAEWKHYIQCFDLENNFYLGFNDDFRIYKEQKIILTPFFNAGRGMNNKNIGILVEKIKELKLNPF